MDRTEIFTRLQSVFDAVFLHHVDVTETLTAKDVEEWDSMMHIALVVAIEREFRIRFRTGEVERAQNVGELATLIARRIDVP